MTLGLADYQLSIGGVVLGPNTSYIVSDFQGLGITDVRTSDVPQSQSDGDYYGVDTRGPHTVTVPITVRGVDQATTLANYDALIAQWKAAAGSTSPLTFKLPGRVEQRLDGRPRRFTADLSRLSGARIMVQAEYFCAKAVIESSDLLTAALTLPAAPSARSYPKTYPRVYGAGVSGDALVTNVGTATAYPTLTINGPVTNPYIQNVTTGETITISIVLGVGDVLTINCDPGSRTVTINGTASRRSSVLAGSQWPTVPAGSSDFKFGGTPGAGTPTASVAWRYAWLG